MNVIYIELEDATVFETFDDISEAYEKYKLFLVWANYEYDPNTNIQYFEDEDEYGECFEYHRNGDILKGGIEIALEVA